MKNKKGLIIFSIIGTVLVVAGILLFIFLPKKSNKELYISALKKSLGFVSGEEVSAESSFKAIQEKLEKSNYKLTINSESRQDEAGYSKSQSVLYFGKDKAYFKGSKEENDLTYVIESMFKNDKLYFNIKDVLENIYYIDKISEYMNSSDDSFSNKIAEYMCDAFVDALNSKDVTIGYSDKKINDVTYKTTLHSYSFTGETLYDFVVSFVKNLQDDKEIYKEIGKYVAESGVLGDFKDMKLTRDQVNEMLNEVIKGAESLKQLGSLALYNIYMYNDEPICTEIIITGQDAPTITLYNINDNDKQYVQLLVSNSYSEMFNFVYNEKIKGTGEISVYQDGKQIIEGYIKEDNGSYEIKLNGVGDTADNYILLTMKDDNSGTIKIVSDTNNINVTYKVEKVDEIPEMDVKGSKPYEEITPSDESKIQEIFGMFFPSKKNEISYDYGFEGLGM